MKIILPDLQAYKTELLNKGKNLDLKPVDLPAAGLLAELPACGNNNWPWDEQTDPQVYKTATRWPKLTIVTPSYNQGQFMEQTIRSVLLQNYPNLEFIIIDGGSTDNTREIIEKYSSWISYWQMEKDRGQSHAINIGFSLASGDYLAWINSDDYYIKDVFAEVITTFITSQADFIYGYGFNYDTAKKKFDLVKVPPLLDPLLRFPSIMQPSSFWSKKIHQPLWEELHCSLDYELWIRILRGVKRKLIKHPLSVANVHIDAKTSDPKMGARWAKDHELICSKDAYGPVKNWHLTLLLNRIWIKMNRMIGQIS